MRAEVTLNYDADTAAAMLAALLTCPREQRLDTLAVVVKAFVESTPASADLRGETHTPAANSLCRVEYKPFQRFEPIARIVRCGLPAGHDGDHDELIDGELGSNPWPQDHPSGTFPPAADPLDEAIEAARQLCDGRMAQCRSAAGADCGGCHETPRDSPCGWCLAAVRAAAPIIAAPILAERDEARAGYHEALASVRRLDRTVEDIRDLIRPAIGTFADESNVELVRRLVWRLTGAEAERERLKIAKGDMLAALNRLGDEVDLSEAVSYMDVAECAVHAIRWYRAEAERGEVANAELLTEVAELLHVRGELAEARDDLEVANAHVGALRARMAKLAGTAVPCTCKPWPPEGPDPACAVHGAVRGLNEANVELADLRARLADAERQRDQLERDIETIVADWHRQAADAEWDALNRAADELPPRGMLTVGQFAEWLRERAKAVKP